MWVARANFRGPCQQPLTPLCHAPSQIVRTARLFWTVPEAAKFYEEHVGKFYFPRLIAGMTSGPSMAIALSGHDAIARWRAMLGPTKVYRGKWEEPLPVGLRSMYGLGDTRNGFHGSGKCSTEVWFGGGETGMRFVSGLRKQTLVQHTSAHHRS